MKATLERCYASLDPPYDVLFSMPWAGPLLDSSRATGGAEAQILMVARGLAASGLRVGLLVTGDRSTVPDETDGVHVLTQPRAPDVPGLGGLLHDVHTLLALLRSPARVIVQRNASRSVAVAALAARMRGVSFAYSSANVVDFDLGRIDRSYNVRLFEWGARAAAKVIVQTDEQAELCRRRFGRDPITIRSIAERAEKRRDAPEAFLWIGRLAPYKRLGVYLELVRDVPEAQFQVIAVPAADSQPEMISRLERAREELPNLEVLDPRPRAQLAPLIGRAVAIVNTSEYEGMPNIFLESWSRGVPALAFSHDPDGVVVRHGLGAFAAGSRQRFAELARAQWASRQNQREIAERCIAYVRDHHDVNTVCAAWRTALTGIGAA